MKKLGKRVEKHSKKLGCFYIKKNLILLKIFILQIIKEFALLFWKHKTYKCFEDPEIVN